MHGNAHLHGCFQGYKTTKIPHKVRCKSKCLDVHLNEKICQVTFQNYPTSNYQYGLVQSSTILYTKLHFSVMKEILKHVSVGLD